GRRLLPRPARGAGPPARRRAAVPHVHLRHHRPPQGRAAQHRRLPRLRDRDLEVLPGHPPRRHLLVHGRHRVDHRPLLHRPPSAGSGPRPLGPTGVIYEATPNSPDAGRPGRIAERLGVNISPPSPPSIRLLRKVGPDEPAKYNYHFKHMTTVGEPIEPEVWR